VKNWVVKFFTSSSFAIQFRSSELLKATEFKKILSIDGHLLKNLGRN
jgi:hypothetical protein